MRPFRCSVTILNTLDHLGKFDGKSDDRFFVGYSINSKAFRVFNTRTRFVEENLHINFLENKPNVARTGPNWMFDIDTLTMSMNYQPVFSGNQTNGNVGPKSPKDEVADDAGKKNGVLDLAKEGDKNDQEKDVRDQEEALRKQFEQESERLFWSREATNTNNTNRLNTVSSSVNAVSSTLRTVIQKRTVQRKMFTPVSTAESSYVHLGGSIPVNVATLPNANLPIDPLIPELEDTVDLQVTGIFSSAYDDEDVGAEADLNNLETIINVSPIPTTKIHKDHPKDQIIRDINSATQTRRMTKISKEHAMKVIQALTDPSWIEAMQDKLLQFRLQKVWRLVDLPKGKHAIGTKWEEGIDYDEVFAPVARIEAIRLFLAYASFMGFIMYQMDVKSAFLYGTIEEEVYVCQPPGFEDPQFPDKVYKVEKALYGLHQAPRAWYETLSTYLLQNRFRRGIIDKTLFIKKDKGDILLVQVYVDDIIFGSTKKSLCTEFEGLMHKKFQMSSMGELTFFLGLQVMQRGDGIFISQDKYVADILKKFDFSSVKIASTPIETNKALLKDEEDEDVDTIVANSTTEAEYVAAANCCGQITLAEPFNDIYVTPVHTKKVFTNMKRQNKDFSRRITPLFASMLVPQVVKGEGLGQPSEPQPPSSTAPPSQSSGPPKKVGDEAIYIREDDRVVSAASSLEAEQESGNIHKARPTVTLNEPSPQGIGSGSGPRRQDTTLGGVDAQTRPETASK
ncbi:putative ribonuclease H-like domain-containing protein [Tanacetum coccineum]